MFVKRTYVSVAALLADTTPAGIVAGEFAIIDTGTLNGSGVVSVIAKKFTDICYQRSGNVWQIFVDGNIVLETTQAGVVVTPTGKKLRIGIWGNGTAPLSSMSIQQFRFTSASRYNGPYTPIKGSYPTSI